MIKDSRLFDDLSRLTSDALGTAADMKREMEAMMLDKIERVLERMHLVRKEEFEVMRLMVEQARLKQEKLEDKLAHLEKLLESHETLQQRPVDNSKK